MMVDLQKNNPEMYALLLQQLNEYVKTNIATTDASLGKVRDVVKIILDSRKIANAARHPAGVLVMQGKFAAAVASGGERKSTPPPAAIARLI